MGKENQSGEWPDLVRDFVFRRQRDAYRSLGEHLGLGSEPQEVFARLTRPPMPKPRGTPAHLPLNEEERARFERGVGAAYEKWSRHVEAPTPLEDPNRYAILRLCYELEKHEPEDEGAGPGAEPPLATLPLGSPNAWISEIPGGGRRAIFFDYALFDYLHDFSKLMGLILPYLPVHRIGDAEIASLATAGARRFQVPPAAPPALAATLSAWAVTSRTGEPSPLPASGPNSLLSAAVLHYTERFVVAHELAHLHLGHLDRPRRDAAASYEMEYEADREGADRVCRGDPREAGSWGLRRWCVDVALSAFALFDQTLRHLAHGGRRVTWISPTHPDFLSRRKRLRLESPQAAPSEVALVAYRTLCSLSDKTLKDLWPWVFMVLQQQRERGQRPSILWQQRLETSMRVESAEGA